MLRGLGFVLCRRLWFVRYPLPSCSECPVALLLVMCSCGWPVSSGPPQACWSLVRLLDVFRLCFGRVGVAIVFPVLVEVTQLTLWNIGATAFFVALVLRYFMLSHKCDWRMC